ncbi:hypothetical protein P167DRAFT_401649 [Morchella conica CCBAS932]|uniref:Uncharacterized protein n=1 Tax=Morchella conica CCBAS932 TaxID=1392247 RepID=A0A3N4KGG7_9PEZI|nr:hypothetical protein P167DRAFT_401649 [Morchella conica CCBAS932]
MPLTSPLLLGFGTFFFFFFFLLFAFCFLRTSIHFHSKVILVYTLIVITRYISGLFLLVKKHLAWYVYGHAAQLSNWVFNPVRQDELNTTYY